jgi:hypothetical protein
MPPRNLTTSDLWQEYTCRHTRSLSGSAMAIENPISHWKALKSIGSPHNFMWLDPALKDLLLLPYLASKKGLVASLARSQSFSASATLRPLLILGRRSPDLGRRLSLPEDDDLASSVHAALATLFHKPWWSRLWVIQELFLSQHVVFACGNQI